MQQILIVLGETHQYGIFDWCWVLFDVSFFSVGDDQDIRSAVHYDSAMGVDFFKYEFNPIV